MKLFSVDRRERGQEREREKLGSRLAQRINKNHRVANNGTKVRSSKSLKATDWRKSAGEVSRTPDNFVEPRSGLIGIFLIPSWDTLTVDLSNNRIYIYIYTHPIRIRERERENYSFSSSKYLGDKASIKFLKKFDRTINSGTRFKSSGGSSRLEKNVIRVSLSF